MAPSLVCSSRSSPLPPLPPRHPFLAHFIPSLILPRVTGIAKTAETENAKPSGWISRTLANSSAFAPMNRKLEDLKETWAESEDPFVAKTRQISNWFGRMTEENETAKVTRLFRILDPSYHQEEFAKELREYVIPEVLDAYWTMDKEALQAWCGEAVSRRAGESGERA